MNIRGGITLLIEAIAYALAGLFLLTITPNLLINLFGWVFVAFAAFLIVRSLLNKPNLWGDRIDIALAFPLFTVTAADFIIKSVESQQNLYIIFAFVFLLLLLLAIMLQIWRGCQSS